MTKPIAAVTGASAGIGAVFAEKLAARGFDLILIARRKDRLDELAAKLGGSHEVLTADLAEPDDIARVGDRLRAEPRLELLVNNAGFGTKGRFAAAPLEQQVRMHRVHIDATLALTHAALQGMVARDRGAIISVSSVAGFARSPGNVSYCATKSWINAFTEGLHIELAGMGSKVKVQALCPGFTYTEFHDVLGVSRDGVPKWFWMSADRVVEDSLRGLERGRLFVIPGWQYKVIAGLIPRLPTGLRVRLQGASPHSRARV